MMIHSPVQNERENRPLNIRQTLMQASVPAQSCDSHSLLIQRMGLPLHHYREGVLDSLRVLEELDATMAETLLRELQAREVRATPPGTVPQQAPPVLEQAVFPDTVPGEFTDVQFSDNTVDGHSFVELPAADGVIILEEPDAASGHIFPQPATMVPKAKVKPRAKPKIAIQHMTHTAHHVGRSRVPDLLGAGPTIVSEAAERPTTDSEYFPYGWTMAGPVIAFSIEPEQVTLRSFLTMVKTVEEYMNAIAMNYSSITDGSDYYTCRINSDSGGFKFGVTRRLTTSRVPDFMALGPRMYFSGLPRNAALSHACMGMMLSLRHTWGNER